MSNSEINHFFAVFICIIGVAVDFRRRIIVTIVSNMIVWTDNSAFFHSIYSYRINLEIPKRVDLVYLDDSPNYCDRNLRLGSLGTTGRPCNLTARADLNGCDFLCCKRGYNTHEYIRETKCRCKFKWCCEVQCDTCRERIEQYTCK